MGVAPRSVKAGRARRTEKFLVIPGTTLLTGVFGAELMLAEFGGGRPNPFRTG